MKKQSDLNHEANGDKYIRADVDMLVKQKSEQICKGIKSIARISMNMDAEVMVSRSKTYLQQTEAMSLIDKNIKVPI